LSRAAVRPGKKFSLLFSLLQKTGNDGDDRTLFYVISIELMIFCVVSFYFLYAPFNGIYAQFYQLT